MTLPIRRALVLLSLLFACAVAATAQEPVIPVSELALYDPLPPLRGNNLNGRATDLPRDVSGRRALLALGFTSGSRHDVEAWTERFRKTYGPDSSCTFYEIPVLGGMVRIMRPMIDGGMKKGTPPELRAHAMTVWQDAGDWKKRVGWANC